jgi:hypothetical protein
LTLQTIAEPAAAFLLGIARTGVELRSMLRAISPVRPGDRTPRLFFCTHSRSIHTQE